MKLRTQILALGLSGALLAGLAGGIGLFTSARLGDSLSDAVQGSHALQTSQDADMMHDALRGDAQLALLGALEKNADRVAEAQSGLKEHAERFDAALTRLEGMPLSAASKESLATVHPLVRKYVEAVSTVVSLSATDVTAAQAAMPALQSVFTELETQMAGLSGTIEKNSEAVDATASSRVKESAVSISTALAFAVVMMTVAALSLARSMSRPIDHAVSVADSLA
jgi:hypothetical protein